MADLTHSSWSQADSSNTQPAPNGFPSGILPSEVGGTIRAVMGATKRAFDRSNAMVSSTGSATAWVLTYEVGPAAYTRGEVFRFFAHVANTGAATININGLGARNLLRVDGTALVLGDIVAGQMVTATYDGTAFRVQEATSKTFRDTITMSRAGDAIVFLEDTSAPENSYRRKAIFSSRNVGGGNDWLFRQYRPSDNAVENFYLKSGTGGDIWTTGNFNPNDRVATAGGSTITGQTSLAQGVAIKFNSSNALNHNDGRVGARLTERGLNIFGIASESGDTTRYVTSWGDWRNNGSLTLTNTLSTTGASMTGALNLSYADPTINFFGSNGTIEKIMLAGDSSIQFRDGANNTNFSFQHSGAIWTRQFGDLATRIDSRARTLGDQVAVQRRDEALASVAANYASKTAATRQDFQGDILINKDNPRLKIDHQGVGGFSLLVHDDNRLYIQKESAFAYQSNAISIGAGGDIWTAQLGDLNTRIDARAAAFANSAAGTRVSKTGDTMTGALNMSYADPTINFFGRNSTVEKIMLAGDSSIQFRDGNNAVNFSFQQGGKLWTRELGDINERIEARARAWAETRQANIGFTPVQQGGGANMGSNKVYIGWDGPARALRAQVDGTELERILTRNWINPIIDFRMTMAGELANDWSQGQSFVEPYGGAVITTRRTSSSGVVDGFRWRYMQKQDSYGNWYTVGYA